MGQERMMGDPSATASRRSKTSGPKKSAAERDAEYRRALGLDPSAGGRGAAQKGKGMQS